MGPARERDQLAQASWCGLGHGRVGTVQVIHADCEREVFEPGETFVEEGGVHLGRNRGNVNAVVYVTFIIPSKTPADGLTIPVDAPEGCNV